MSKPGISSADWDRLLELLRDALPPEWFRVVEGILHKVCTFYV
jgi:hypothetical protein